MKPPNVLVYFGGDDILIDEEVKIAKEMVDRCLHEDLYAVYHLKQSDFLHHPWSNNCNCIIVINTPHAQPEWDILAEYWKSGGRILFLAHGHSLESYIEDSPLDPPDPAGILRLIGSCTQEPIDGVMPHLRSVLRLSGLSNGQSSDAATVIAHGAQNWRITGGTYRSQYCASGVLLILMVDTDSSNSDDGQTGTAVFTDIELFHTQEETQLMVLQEALGKLGLSTKVVDVPGCSRLPQYTPGYMFYANQVAADRMVQHTASLTKITGTLELNFIKELDSRSGLNITENIMPVIIDARIDAEVGFNREGYFSALNTKYIGKSVLYVPVIRSSSAIFERWMYSLPEDINIVAIPRQQTHGKGRGRNAWLSPIGCAMFSIVLRYRMGGSRITSSLPFIQHLVGLAVVEGICGLSKDYQDLDLRLKWPNDIYWRDEVKLGGVLVNSVIMGDKIYCIIGCGVNVANSIPTKCINDFLPADVPPLDPDAVIARALTCLEDLLDTFEYSGASALHQRYYKYWLHSGQTVAVAGSEGDAAAEQAQVEGIDESGFLMARMKTSGKMCVLHPDGNSFDMMKGLIRLKEC